MICLDPDERDEDFIRKLGRMERQVQREEREGLRSIALAAAIIAIFLGIGIVAVFA